MSLDIPDFKPYFRQTILEVEGPDWSQEKKRLFRQMSLSRAVIASVLSVKWVERHLGSLDAAHEYFKMDVNDDTTTLRSFIREIEFAELLINLKDVVGIEKRAEMIRTDTRGIESGIGELIGGKLFKYLGVDFVFKETSGVYKDDYDIDYIRADGQRGRCEVKTNLQSTPYSETVVANTLKGAKGQLPKGETGVILLHIPEVWVPFVDGVERLKAIIAAINGWFATEKTSRVNSVVLVDSRADDLGDSMRAGTHFHEYYNPFCLVKSGLPDLTNTEILTARYLESWEPIPGLVQKWFA